jgi:alanine racemase
MKPAMTVVSRVRRVFCLEPGDGVSYGASFRAAGREVAALIPIGYADGYPRAVSNQSWMSVGGVACPVRGRVCMDQTVIGVPEGAEVELGDTVIVGGADDQESVPSFDALASIANTINYELVAGIDRRVPRYFMKSGTVVGIEDLHGYRQIRAAIHSNA